MDKAPLTNRDELISLVRSLIEEVQGLSGKFDQYASREEVTREGRRRAWRFLGLAVVVIMASQFLTISMISYCFLGSTVTTNEHIACRIMPGYDRAIQDGQARLGRFTTLLDATENDRKRLDDIDKRLNKLEQEDGK